METQQSPSSTAAPQATSTKQEEVIDDVRLVAHNVVLARGDDELGAGTLEVSTQTVSWKRDSDGKTISYEYPEIMLHAVCKDDSAYPQPCIYCHMERGGETVEVRYVPPTTTSSNDDSNNAGGDSATAEQEGEGTLERIFRVMSECASLHPDPDDEHGPGECASR